MPYDPSTPVDLAAAGGTESPANQNQMLDALRPRGGLSEGLLDALKPAPPSTSRLFAEAVTGGLNPAGVNHYRAERLQQEQQAQRQALMTAQMAMQRQSQMEAIQARKAQREYQQNKAAFDALNKMVFDPAIPLSARQGLAKQFGAQAKQFLGIEIPTSILDQSIASPDVDRVLLDLHRGMPDPLIRQAHPNLKPEDIPLFRGMLKNPAALESIKAKTPEQRAKDALDLDIKEGQAIQAQRPEMGSKDISEAARLFSSLYPGKRFYEGTDEQQHAALAQATAIREAREDKVRRESEAARLQNSLTLLGARADAKGEQPLTPGQQVQMGKWLDVTKGQAQTIRMIDNVLDQVDRMSKKGILPTSTDYASIKIAQFNRNIRYRGDSDVMNFQNQFAPLAIGKIERGMLDDKGVRIKDAFGKVFNVPDEMPPAQAIKDYLNFYRGELITSMRKDLEAKKGLGARPEVLDTMRVFAAPYLGESKHELPPREQPAAPALVTPDAQSPLTDPRQLYKTLLQQGRSPAEAQAELKRRGYAIQ